LIMYQYQSFASHDFSLMNLLFVLLYHRDF